MRTPAWLRRLERSAFIGAAVGIVGMVVQNSHHHVAASAAAAHVSTAKYLFHGFLMLGAWVAAVVFVAWSLGVYAIGRRNRGPAPARRMRREDW